MLTAGLLIGTAKRILKTSGAALRDGGIACMQGKASP